MKLTQNKSAIAGILLCSWLLGGCEKEVIVPDLEGDIIGYLYTYDEFGPLSDYGGVRITTQGLDGSYTAYSDANGRYQLNDLPAGTYELVFSKEGFRNDTMRSVKHLGGKPTILATSEYFAINRWTYLYKFPLMTVQNITLEDGQIIIDFNYPGTPGKYVTFMLYLSDQSNFDIKSAVKIYSKSFLLVDGVYKSLLLPLEIPFEENQEFYVKAAALSYGSTQCATINDDGNYVQCNTESIFYPLLGDVSSQFTLVLPG